MYLAAAALVTASACSGSEVSVVETDRPRDPDAISLAAASLQAIERAQEVTSDAVLRQVDMNPDGGPYWFRLTDKAATLAVTIRANELADSPDDWRVQSGHLTPLLGHAAPGIDVRALLVGPSAVKDAALAHWPECDVRSLGLTGSSADLTWYVFCNLPGGVVSGTVHGTTGAFFASPAPPAQPPPTAVPDSPR